MLSGEDGRKGISPGWEPRSPLYPLCAGPWREPVEARTLCKPQPWPSQLIRAPGPWPGKGTGKAWPPPGPHLEPHPVGQLLPGQGHTPAHWAPMDYGRGAVQTRNKRAPHLGHCVLWDGRKVGGGEGEATVCPSVVWVKVHGDLLPPAAPVTQVQTVHPHKPVRAGNNSYHKGHLGGQVLSKVATTAHASALPPTICHSLVSAWHGPRTPRRSALCRWARRVLRILRGHSAASLQLPRSPSSGPRPRPARRSPSARCWRIGSPATCCSRSYALPLWTRRRVSRCPECMHPCSPPTTRGQPVASAAWEPCWCNSIQGLPVTLAILPCNTPEPRSSLARVC